MISHLKMQLSPNIWNGVYLYTWSLDRRSQNQTCPVEPACLLLKCSQKRCEQTSRVEKVRENVPGFFVLVPRFTLQVSECSSDQRCFEVRQV